MWTWWSRVKEEILDKGAGGTAVPQLRGNKKLESPRIVAMDLRETP